MFPYPVLRPLYSDDLRPREPSHWRGWLVLGAALGVLSALLLLALFLISSVRALLQAPSLAQTAAGIEQQTEAARGLHAPHPVAVTILPPDEFGRFVRGRYLSRGQMSEDRRLGRIYAMLGIIGPGTDLAHLLATHAQSDIVGLYVPARKRMYVESHTSFLWFRRDLTLYDQFVLAHEYTHALQDQNFGFARIYPRDPSPSVHNTDQALAIQAIVEGDAGETRNLRAQQSLSPDQIDELNRQIRQNYQAYQKASAASPVPPFFSDIAAFPYSQGQRYVEQKRDGNSFAAIDEMYRYGSYPCSTWDILGVTVPDYTDSTQGNGCGDATVTNVPRAAILRGWTMRDSDVMGALRLEEMFGARGFAHVGYRGRELFDDVGPQWAEDRYALYTKGDRSIVLWHVSEFSGAPKVMADFAAYFDRAFSYDLAVRTRVGPCQVIGATNEHGSIALLFPSAARGDLYIALSPDRNARPLVERVVRQAGGSCGGS